MDFRNHLRRDENNRKSLGLNADQFRQPQLVVGVWLVEYNQQSESVLKAAFVDDVPNRGFHLNAIIPIKNI